MFSNYFGNPEAVRVLKDLVASDRIPQTILLAGPEGVGKATLARRFAAALLGDPDKIEQDDLSLEGNLAIVADREKWTPEKRNDDPLLFSTHPDFVTFAPDGPLRQITVQQMRRLKEIAQYKPLRGSRRVFLVDRLERANETAANSLLKTLEEPPAHLIIVLTAQNAYDLLPTIRSRAVTLTLGPLSSGDLLEFLKLRGSAHPDRRAALAAGSAGLAVSLDLEAYEERRSAMLTLLEVAAGIAPFGEWAKHSEAMAQRRFEKLESLLGVLYVLLEDVLLVSHGLTGIRNVDIRKEIHRLAEAVTFRWIRSAVERVDELTELARRNIQKPLALDAFAVARLGG